MAAADSIFLFEIAVEELKVHCNCKEFLIKTRFADMFQVNLKDPNDKVGLSTQPTKKFYSNANSTMRMSPRAAAEKKSETKVISGQSVLLPSNIFHLIADMKESPMEVSMWRRRSPTSLLGLATIPWNQSYLDYLEATLISTEKSFVSTTNTYNVLSPYKSKLIATIKLRVKLTHLRDSLKMNFPHLKQYAILNNVPPCGVEPLYEDEKNILLYNDKKEASCEYLSLCENVTPCEVETDVSPCEAEKEPTEPETVLKIESNHYDNNDINHIETVRKNPSLEDQTKPNSDQLIYKELAFCQNNKMHSNILNLIRSETSIKTKALTIKGFRSVTDFIFNNYDRPSTKQLYYVGYMSVAKDSPKSRSPSPKSGSPSVKSTTSNQSPNRDESSPSDKSGDCSCRKVSPYCRSGKSLERPCSTRCLKMRCAPDEVFLNTDNGIYLKMDTEERLVGGMKAKMHLSESMCDCTCECTYGYTKTTYCNICRGYEVPGDDELKTAFPCPIFHKLVEQKKLKSYGSAEGSDKLKNDKKRDSRHSAQSLEPAKKIKRKIDVRFKFDYGYKGIPPKIGHANCGFPCGGGGRPGIDPNVPRHMGWLWTAENVPGLKFRPSWKPGAASKQVVRLLRIAKNPGEETSKKRRKKPELKKRKNDKHALLIIHKRDGEYNIAMETMKMFPKSRTLNQYPYEDKEPLIYTIGRTEEENLERKKVKEKRAKRLEAEKRAFIQKTFQNMCQDICIRTYRQALGILPKIEEPLCKCFPDEPPPDIFGLEIPCPCSDDENLSNLESATDSDEWIVEFTPPNANFDPGYKPPRIILIDHSTQYSYLDYRVKLLDRSGAEVPRFFKGPDGKEQCSDLGGFWSPDHKWLEINVDGFIGPDLRWAPMLFFGPNGEQVEASEGKFQAADGLWYEVGVDGYVDEQGKWRSRKGKPQQPKKQKIKLRAGAPGRKKEEHVSAETSFTCFGNIAPEDLATLGIVGHGQDKKMLYSNFKQLAGKGIPFPKPSTVPRAPPRRKHATGGYDPRPYFTAREKCVHPTPSSKGVLAVDKAGHKKYFKTKGLPYTSQKDRLVALKEQGISLSSFHAPCFHSFLNKDVLQQGDQGDQQRFRGAHKVRPHFADTPMEYGTIMQRHGYDY